MRGLGGGGTLFIVDSTDLCVSPRSLAQAQTHFDYRWTWSTTTPSSNWLVNNGVAYLGVVGNSAQVPKLPWVWRCDYLSAKYSRYLAIKIVLGQRHSTLSPPSLAPHCASLSPYFEHDGLDWRRGKKSADSQALLREGRHVGGCWRREFAPCQKSQVHSVEETSDSCLDWHRMANAFRLENIVPSELRCELRCGGSCTFISACSGLGLYDLGYYLWKHRCVLRYCLAWFFIFFLSPVFLFVCFVCLWKFVTYVMKASIV